MRNKHQKEVIYEIARSCYFMLQVISRRKFFFVRAALPNSWKWNSSWAKTLNLQFSVDRNHLRLWRHRVERRAG